MDPQIVPEYDHPHDPQRASNNTAMGLAIRISEIFAEARELEREQMAQNMAWAWIYIREAYKQAKEKLVSSCVETMEQVGADRDVIDRAVAEISRIRPNNFQDVISRMMQMQQEYPLDRVQADAVDNGGTRDLSASSASTVVAPAHTVIDGPEETALRGNHGTSIVFDLVDENFGMDDSNDVFRVYSGSVTFNDVHTASDFDDDSDTGFGLEADECDQDYEILGKASSSSAVTWANNRV